MTRFLSPMALDFLWESVGAGEPPYPLDVRSHGPTEDERSALRQQVYGELRAEHLLDRDGRVEPRLEGWLALLANWTHSIDAVSSSVAALAVGDSTSGLLATQDTEGVWLRPIDPDALASSIVDLLPPHPRGTEQSITMPAEELSSLAAGRPVADRQVLARISNQEKLRAGQLAANARKPLGVRTRSPVLAWFDTESGRYLTYTSRGRDNHDWITIAPADAATLRHRLGELLHMLNLSPIVGGLR